MQVASGRALVLCVWIGGLVGASLGCKGETATTRNEPSAVSTATPAFELRSLSADGGGDGGPNCSGSGTPNTGIDGGSSCLGVLAQSTFTQAICSCTTLTASNSLTTDGFNSVNGPPDGGLGGGIASDQSENWSARVSVGGNLQTPSNLTSSNTSVVRGNLLLGGTATASATLTVDGNASVVKTLPPKVVVDGTTTKVSSIATPCDCTNIVPIASIVSAHASSNDNATIGLSANAAAGGSQSLRIDLPCGNYYLSQINMSAPLTIWAHGHTALFVGGNVTTSNTFTLGMDTTATLDVFVAGNVTTSNTFTLGSTAVPAQCRMYMSGASLDISGTATFGCNLYAPSVLFDESGVANVYGSLFVNSFTTSAATTVHYDQAIQSASNECCTAQSCDDKNPCTTDTCNGDGTCSHTPVANGATCPTGTNLCDQTYTCQAGVCTGSNPVTCTASDQCHVAGTCNPSTGQCSNPAAANGTTCNDGNACDLSDTCQAGVCTAGSHVTCTASDQCHVAGTCNPSTGQCSNPAAANGTTCSDGNACDLNDACQSGVCTAGSHVTCTASDQCHVAGTCNPSTGLCSNPTAPNGTTCSDGNACDLNDTCQAGVCTASSHVTCTASDQCHVAGTCNPSTGQCSNPAAANGTACNDGNACDLNDTCQAGVCTAGSHVTCTASDQCHTAGTCNPNTGQCSNPAAANGTSCNDGNACDLNDTCQSGVCTAGSHVTCSASDQCHVAGTCNPSTGQCSNPSAANGTACNDGNACDLNDTCQSGVCTAGSHVTCTASDQCHVAGTCNPSTGQCSNPAAANGTTCSDGNACDLNDTCQSGVCTAGAHVSCTASDQCHLAGTCDPNTGQCSNPAAPNGTGCNDGNACDLNDSCQAGVCTAGSQVTCTASDQCHVAGTCDPSTGQCSNPAAANGTACNDGNACDSNDTCQAGVCTAGSHVTCAASDQCHVAGTCDPSTGQCSNPPAADGTSCTGTNACFQSYSCVSGACTGSSPVVCPAPTPQIVAAAPMSSPRAEHAAVELPGGDVLVTGGTPDFEDSSLATAEIFHVPTQAWVPTGSMSTPRYGHTATLLQSGKVLVAGGYDSSNVEQSSAEIFDPATGTWTSTGAMLAPAVYGHAVLLASGKVLAAGGSTDRGELFDPTSGTWSKIAASKAPGLGFGEIMVLLADGRVLVAGGGRTSAASIFDPSRSSWTPAPPMPSVRTSAVGALLPNGTVLVAGGEDQNSKTLADAVTYDPVAAKWSPAGTMSVPREFGAAVSLPNGDVLVYGDFTATGGDLFNSTAATWTPIPSSTSRYFLTATLSGSGAVLLSGGYDPKGNTLGSADLFKAPDPQCSSNTCDPHSGQCSTANKPDGTACSTGDACFQTQICQAGFCAASNPVVCPPSNNPCLPNACDPSTGACKVTPVVCPSNGPCQPGFCSSDTGGCITTYAPPGTACNDGNLCVVNAVCSEGGACIGTPKCQPPDACHTASCDPTTGACSITALADGSSCNDGNACDLNATCQAGVCTAGGHVTCTASDQCHVAGTCNPSTGQCSNPTVANGTACNDGNACDLNDTCQAGVCTAGSQVTCTASDSCHVAGTCNPSTGTCSNPPAPNGTACNDGNACDLNNTCQAGVCTAGSHVTCTASDQCHLAGTCDPSTGTCSNPQAANGAPCNDGNACDTNDTCQAGVCTAGGHVTCTASDQCHAAGTCNPSTGQCSNPAAPNGTACNDGNACDTNDTCQAGVCTAGGHVTCTPSDQCHVASCNPSTGACTNSPAGYGTPCNDGNACTQNDFCNNGVCGGNPVTCTASDQCHSAGTCNPSTGVCSNPTAPDGTFCNDNNFCTQSSSCQAGVCVGSNPITCTAADQCHVAGTCDPQTGYCSKPFAPNGTSCSDGNACTQGDSCQSGVCEGTPVTCTASDQCHAAGTCDKSTGQCSNPAAPNGTSCNDGNACDTNDTCQAGVCTAGGHVTCTPIDACHTASCDPKAGCTNAVAPDGTACPGSDKCNQRYACVSGSCVGSDPVVCTASDVCHVAGTCDQTSGSCSNPAAANGTSCTDGNACTQGDTCQSGTCTAGTAVTCTALDACHLAGVCDPVSGACSNPAAPNGTSCGTGDAGALVCSGGTCGPQTACTPSQTLCSGVCTSTQSSASNCGACGHACPAGYACAAGNCVSPQMIASCGEPTGPIGVQFENGEVTAYVASSRWSTGNFNILGIERFVVEGDPASPSAAQIPTQADVTGCSSNWVTGQTVCIASGTGFQQQTPFVYELTGSSIDSTFVSSSNRSETFSGGGCDNCGVTIDPSTNLAVITEGFTPDGGVGQGAYQFLDLNSNTLEAPISAGVAMSGPFVGATEATSEDIALDSVRHMIVSANETGLFQIVQYGSTPTVFDNQFPLVNPQNNFSAPQFDAVAEDCTTGIAIAAHEEAPGLVSLVDLTQATFVPGSPKGTWSAPTTTMTLDGVETTGGTGESGAPEYTALSLAPGSHLGILGEEYGDGSFVVFELPSGSGSGAPSMVDWAVALIKNDPSGATWTPATDPHSVAAYVSPNTGRVVGLMTDLAGLSGPPYIARIDMQAVLSAPRVSGTHVIDPTYDLVAHGVISFSQRPCNGVDFDTDVSNCGACAHICASEPNAQPSCFLGTCKLVCKQGTADCDGNYANGCEAVLATDVNDCGACGHACASSPPNATSICAAGACGLQCNVGYSDCDGNSANGCETHSPSCGSPNISIAGPTSVNVGDVVTFTATATDPVPSRTLSYAWTQISGPQDIFFSAQAALSTTTTFPVAGNYVIQFEANDGFATTAGTVTVFASKVDHASVAISGPTTVKVGVPATYMGTPSQTQGATLTFQWSAISGPGTVTFSAPTAQTTSALFSAAGTYVLQLQMSDGTATTTPTLTVTAALVNLPPVVTMPSTLTVTLVGSSVTATLPATVTDDGLPAGGTISASWEQRTGPTQLNIPGYFRSGPEPGPLDASTQVTFTYPGIYVFELAAYDSAGASSPLSEVTVTVTGNAPCPGTFQQGGANLNTDPNNCGACGQVCPIEPNSAPSCNVGVCALVCNLGYADCDFYYGDGCEVNLTNDPNNCGNCGHTCGAPHEGTCTGGFCGCDPGYNDCDNNSGNGCETFGACGPTVSISGPTVVTYNQVAQGQPLTYTATVTDPVPGRTLSYAWTQISGPPQGTVTYSAPSSLTTLATFTTPDLSYIVPGVYVIQFEANDGYATTAASLTVTFANSPPIVTAGPAQTLTSPTMSTTLSGSATDDGLPLHATMTATWSQMSGPAAAMIAQPTQSGLAEPGPVNSSTSVSFVYPGTYVFQLAVSDTELVGTATQSITVQAPASPGGQPPTVSIGGVTDDEEVTKPTSILGTVSDGSWVLERRLGGRDDVNTPWTVVASGTGAVSGTSIYQFDPTLLLNGIYTLRLSSTNSVGSASTSVSLSVTSRMKVGDFTLTFTDLSTQVGELPLTVTRTYDSRDKSIGDFGYGWKLGISDVRVEKSGKTGAYWDLQENNLGFLSQFCLYPAQASSVAITFPNGRQYRFTPQTSDPNQCTYGSPDTTPDITWVSTSDPNNPTIKLVAVDQTSVYTNGSAAGITQLLDLNTAEIWDPRQFVLTIEDGSVWKIDQDLGVTQVTDLNGNYVKITPQGILHSSGKQVTFQRDDQNRITTITDPAGASMTYAYDQNGDLASFTDRASNVTQFAYAANHYLTQIEDPLGRLPVRNDYDSSGRLLSTTDASGNTVHYTPNLSGNQQQVTDRLGHVTLYTYNDRGDITQKVDATGAVWNYTVDARGNQTSVTDPLGHTTSMTYDGADNLLTRTDALGNTTTNTYNFYRELTTTTDPLGHVSSTQYDGFGNAIATSDALGNVIHRTYDPNNNNVLTDEQDPTGARTTYQYDSFGHVTQKTDPLGNQLLYQPGSATTYQYDANGNKTQDSFGRAAYNGTGAAVTTAYTYDALNRLTQTQRVDSHQPGLVSATTYTPTGKRATSTDPLGRVTTYTYDALDRLIQTTYPDHTTTSQTYDAENHRISSTDASGNTTTYAYDPVGRLVRTTYADGTSVSTTYDSAGNAVQTIDENGHITWSAYDAANRLTTTTDAAGDVTRTVYDAAGNRTATIDPAGQITRYAYDAANRLVSTTYADGSSDATFYDPDGRVAARTDTLGRTTNYAYDMLGRLLKVTDAMGAVTQYTYDETGARISQVDANNHLTTFYYDYFANMVDARYLPGGAGETFVIDHAGEITQRTDYAGQTTTYTYDPMGRVLSRSYPDSTFARFTYTPTGQRATETDARGVTTYAYDSRNRLVKLTYPDGRILQYGYDAHGNRTALTATIGGTSFTTATAYDAANRPTTVTDPLGSTFQVTYDADNARTRIQYPNGTHTTYGYDARHRLTSIAAVQDSSNTAIATFNYTLNTEGQRTAVSEADGTQRSYSYDFTSRLTGESVTGSLSYDKSFTYDAVGNRLTQVTSTVTNSTISQSTDTYAYDGRDQLTTVDATTYGYDPNGNITSKAGEASYGWDFEQRLTGVTLTSGATVAHQYDADGNRVRTGVTLSGGSAEVTNMLVDTGCPSCGGSLSQVVAETDGSGNITAVYVRDQDELLEVMRPGSSPGTWTTRFVHSDALGSVRALTDETGTTTDTRAYEAFGTKNVEAGSDLLTYGFAGEPFQNDSMLAYHRARWMDARVGRFASTDPLDHPGPNQTSAHLYSYATDNPVSVTDPTGQDDLVSVGAAIAGFGILATISTVNTPLHDFQATAGGKLWANLRSREVEGTGASHLYIEYVDRRSSERLVFEAKPDFTPGVGKRGYLYGLAPRTWGVATPDPVAIRVKPEALEREDDDYSPLSGITVSTKQCLERWRLIYNSHHIVYDPWSANSNAWAVSVTSACGLSYPAGLPSGFLPDTEEL